MDKINLIIESWKDPKMRKSNFMEHPSGVSFHELSISEMEFVAGGNGTAEPRVTPVTPATPVISKVSVGVSAAGISFVGSFIASAAFDCRD